MTETKPRKLLFLDGHSLAYRAFFALPTSLETKSGQVTNAAYGFTSMLVKLLGDERPDGVVVCFDRGAPTFRVERYPEYKAGRAETPDLFRQQLPLIREVLHVMRIPTIERDGFEADDLLATLARKARERGDQVVIVTGDRDCLQLVTDGVTVMMTRRGISDIARYDAAAVVERYGVPPGQWTDFAALKGETSDNLPGVPGVGDKTAAQLVQTYGSVDQVIAHADELRPRIRDALLACADQIRLNKELGHLLDDVEVDADLEQIRLEPWDDEEVRKLFNTLEFPTIYQRLRELDLVTTDGGQSLDDVTLRELGPDEEVPHDALVSFAWDATWLGLAASDDEAVLVRFEEAPGRLRDLLGDPSAEKVAHDAKPFLRLCLESDVDVRGIRLDTQIGAYVLEPGSPGGYPLQDAARRYLGMQVEPDGEQKPASRAKQAKLDLDVDTRERVARAAVAVRRLAPTIEDHLRNRGMWDLSRALEFPLVYVLSRMERAGVLIDLPYLEELGADLAEKMDRFERGIHQHAGEPFNVNSNLQLQKILFDKLDLQKTKKIKTGYSTDHAELQKLAGTHPIIDELLEYREVAKLKMGFTDSLIPLVNPKTGRIHTTFLQTSASTGRLASTNPNIQNIPIRGDLGRQIRRAFIAPEGHLLLSADYSQIELRVLAHLSGAPGLLDAFASQHDFHAAIAAKVYGVGVSDVQSSMRAYAKQFSYGIAYGMSAYGVSQRLGVDREEAQAFVDAYYAQFPEVKTFLERQVAHAKADGFTTTMLGRRRYLPELNDRNPRIRAMGERMALNAPIQGSAADIIKRAMIDVDVVLRERPHLGTMLLSVHDELVFEVLEEHADEAVTAVRATMEEAADLRCGLAVDVHLGNTWDQAHA